MNGNRLFAVLSLAGLCISSLGLAADPPDTKTSRFEIDVLPILKAKCAQCHGAVKQKASLDVRSPGGLLKGGENGPAIQPGAAEESLLWEKIAGDQMPPGKTKLTSAEKTIIRQWLDSLPPPTGVQDQVKDIPDRPITDADRQFWSFQPPARPLVPTVRENERVRNPVDSFILAALEKKGLPLAPDADRLTLLRRATLDLIGLPPTPQEIESFLADQAPNAYERLIDRLLASEHYGERWGRHWLDIAGYADSEGILDADVPRAAAWRYRDYVIDAFNKDKPYDRFLQEQLAGDELVDYWKAYEIEKELKPEVVEALVATGFLRCASDASSAVLANIKGAQGYYFQTLDDTVKIVASSLLGMTLECARCHNHKYDPISQSEYYRVQAIFMSAYRPKQWVPQEQRHLLEVTLPGQKDGNLKTKTAAEQLRTQAADLKKQYAGYLFTGRLGKLPEQIRDDVRKAMTTVPAKRSNVQKYLVDKFAKDLKPDSRTLDRVLPDMFPAYKTKIKEIEEALKTEKIKGATFPEIRALYDLPGETITHLLRRGEYLHPGREVTPGVLVALATTKPFDWAPPPKEAKSSGRRLAFARWLTQPDHPLTARVFVNRVWMLHFGEGLVNTPDNFGHMGTRPSHPELLDWLASEFVTPTPGGSIQAKPWSLKALHRLILTSAVYRQSSVALPAIISAARASDPENRLLWHFRLHRLEGEVLRDCILSVAGKLNPAMTGPPVPVQRDAEGEVHPPADAAGMRRSVYLQVRRSQPVTFLQVFDQPVVETNCTRRSTSTVASQALQLLNGDFMVQQGEAFADRVLKEKPSEAAAHAFLIAMGRSPSAKEKTRMAQFLDSQHARYAKGTSDEHKARSDTSAARQSLADLCQMLLSSNEFVYID